MRGFNCCIIGCRKRFKKKGDDDLRSDSSVEEDDWSAEKRQHPRTFHSFPRDPLSWKYHFIHDIIQIFQKRGHSLVACLPFGQSCSYTYWLFHSFAHILTHFIIYSPTYSLKSLWKLKVPWRVRFIKSSTSIPSTEMFWPCQDYAWIFMDHVMNMYVHVWTRLEYVQIYVETFWSVWHNVSDT